VRQLVASGHEVTVYHRGLTEADLPAGVCHVHSDAAAIPVLQFPLEVLEPAPEVVIHMIAMGEADARAACEAFRGRSRRLVALSSGDVYRAYGRFTGLEPGPVEPGLLHEASPLRTVLYPYRRQARGRDDWRYAYEKILAERVVLNDDALEAVVLRLPKIYGPGDNADLATVYGFRHRPQWRWTHGYVENVAAAIVLGAYHPAAAGEIYNVGERHTPTVGERLRDLPPSAIEPVAMDANFDQDIAYDTGKIRRELGYQAPVPYAEGLRRTLGPRGA
jgi:nucleoside-diphosphate-sugar epimerase